MDGYEVTSKLTNFTFESDTTIQSVYPYNGDLTGQYPFVLKGVFNGLKEGNFDLFWDLRNINTYITAVTPTEIRGTVPPSEKVGRVEITLLHNLITYQNISTYFTYVHIPVVENCFPRLGPSNGGTMVVITGEHFNEEIRCVFDDYLEIVPIRDGPRKLICEMPAHHETTAKSLNLRAWHG